MRHLFRYPVLSGLGFEAFLIALFLLFPVGSCNTPAIGVAVVILHYPAGIFVERVLGVGFSATQAALTAALMAPVWIALLVGARRVLRPKDGKAAR